MTGLVLVLALLLGGGQGGLGDTLVQLSAILLFAVVSSRLLSGSARPAIDAVCLILLVLAVPVLQWIPFPHYVSRHALGAERALWALLPGCAVYLSALTLPVSRQRQLVGVVWAMCLASLILGLMQLAEGPDSKLRLYSNTNATQAVGFFANRNHLAALFALCLPFSLAGLSLAIYQRSSGNAFALLKIVVMAAITLMLLFGIATTNSRAGLVLGALGMMASVPMMLSVRRTRVLRRGYAIALGLAALFAVGFAIVGAAQRIGEDPMKDDRWELGRTTFATAQKAGPLGTGLGTFRQLYQVAEKDTPGRFNTNHAHNDYLELWLEAGWLFLAALAAFLVLFVRQAISVWRTLDPVGSLWAKAASIAVALLLVHSALDYPLRTTSNQAVFALAMGILFAWGRSESRTGVR